MNCEDIKKLSDPWLDTSIDPIELIIDEKKTIFKECVEQMGIKPVTIIEPFKPEHEDLIRKKLMPLLPNPLIRFRKSHKREKAFELFYGKDKNRVSEAVHLSDLMETEIFSREDFVNKVGRIGELLGYPRCCSIAFARESSVIRTVSEWLHISRRIKNPGEIHFILNPYCSIIEHIPCSLICTETLRIAQIGLTLHRQKFSEDQTSGLADMCKNPFLTLTDRPFQFFEMIPLEEPSDCFSFRGGIIHASDSRILNAAQGDRIVIERENITILKQGKIVEKFKETAFVWWYKKAFNPDYWQEWLDSRFQKGSDYDDVFLKNTISASSEKLRKQILNRLKNRSDLAGFSISSIDPTSEKHVFLTLTSENSRITVKIEPKNLAEKAFIFTEQFAISYRKETPVDTKEKEKAVRILAELLDES
jgi:hypothetical protein